MAFLKVVFYIVVVLWLLKNVIRFVFKTWVSSKIKEAQKASGPREPQRPEGEIYIKKDKSKKPKSDDLGDFVDYEEVKD